MNITCYLQQRESVGQRLRDPKGFLVRVIPAEHGGIWLMIVAGGRARIFSSENLID